jgi:sugar phosphate isomerase/epimerase
MHTLHPQLAVSTWSLHRAIEAGTPLLEIPAQAAAHGLGKLEVCHFHFPSTEKAYLEEFRGALDAAGVQFFTLLIDDFDLTHPDPAGREKSRDEIAYWVGIAGSGGAERARVIAGKQAATDETLRLSADGLRALLPRAHDTGVKLVTENWHQLLDQPADVITLLESLDGAIGLMLDFGNWKGERKYADLAQIAPFATSTHAKADFPAVGQMDRDDFTRCLDLCHSAGFSGPHSLIFDGPIDVTYDEWASLDQIQSMVRSNLHATSP